MLIMALPKTSILYPRTPENPALQKRPAEAIWLDLWNTEFQGGLKVEIEDLTAGLLAVSGSGFGVQGV